MERLTYKFPSLTLANFAVNNIRKDKVGEVTNSQNGYITVETSNIPAVKQIVEGVRGSEIFREALMMAPTGVPVRPNSAVVARLVTHKVPMTFIKQYPMLKKKKDASPGSKIMWSADDNDLDLILAKDVASYAKDGWVIIENFNEQTMEVEILEAFKSSSVPAGASQEVHDKARRENPYKVRLKKGVPAGAGAKKEETEIEEKTKLTPDQLKKMNQGLKGKILDKKNAKKEDMEESASKAALEDFMYALPKAAIEELRPVMKMKQGVGRMAKITAVLKKHGITQKFMGAFPTSVVNDYFDTFHGESVEEAKSMVGGQKKLDANKNGKLDAHDFKLLRAKKEEVEVNEAMNNYLAFYNGKKMTIQAETSYKAQLKAIEMFKAPASKKHMVTVKLADNKAALANNEETEVNEAAPTIKAGMKLRAKENKSVSNGSVVKGEQYKVADAGKNKFDLIHLSIGFRKAIRNVDASVIQALMQNKVLG